MPTELREPRWLELPGLARMTVGAYLEQKQATAWEKYLMAPLAVLALLAIFAVQRPWLRYWRGTWQGKTSFAMVAIFPHPRGWRPWVRGALALLVPILLLPAALFLSGAPGLVWAWFLLVLSLPPLAFAVIVSPRESTVVRCDRTICGRTHKRADDPDLVLSSAAAWPPGLGGMRMVADYIQECHGSLISARVHNAKALTIYTGLGMEPERPGCTRLSARISAPNIA